MACIVQLARASLLAHCASALACVAVLNRAEWRKIHTPGVARYLPSKHSDGHVQELQSVHRDDMRGLLFAGALPRCSLIGSVGLGVLAACMFHVLYVLHT